MSNNRKDCEYRHENGNCLKVGGFYTSVDDKHCEKMKRDDEADNVCEWKYDSTYPFYKPGCTQTRVPIQYGEYCPFCSKKIKVVE